MKKCFRSLKVREMHIKATLRFHLTTIRVAKLAKEENGKFWRICGEKVQLVENGPAILESN